MSDLVLPSFLIETHQDFMFQLQNEIQIPEEVAAKRMAKDLKNIKLKINDFKKDFDEKVAEDRLEKISRLEKNIENHRLKIDKLQTYLNKLNSRIKPLEVEVEALKEVRLKKSEAEKYLLYRYKSSLNIHLGILPQSNDKFIVQVSYFTTVRLDNPKYYIKLLYNRNFKSWQLIEMQPQPKNFKELAEHLMLFQDIQGFFEAARRIFLKYKNGSV